ncbi:GTP 3',8-cyclase [Firmicutes bacterium ASF500]|nr:GTP 3',8-cyclase [Firmicutes bacterium ASF500]
MEINKGNYSIDTLERFESYMKARAFGCEEAFYEYRKNWEAYPAARHVSEYPLSLEFQISDVCNLKCPFCYRGQDSYILDAEKFMDFDLFKKVIDEVAFKVPAIRFNSTGESVLHPQFIEMIKYAKDRGALEVSFITNSGAITLESFEKMLLAGVDWITVSVDGIHEDYEKNRYPLKFKDTYQKLSDMKQMKERYATSKPAINVQGIWSMIEPQIDEYMDMMSQVSDYINYNAFIDFPKIEAEQDRSNYELDFTCAQPFQRMLVSLHGDVYGCCGAGIARDLSISLGNVKDCSVYEIWHGKKYEALREHCSIPGGYREMAMCKECVIPRKIREKIVKIHGQDRIIKEYI